MLVSFVLLALIEGLSSFTIAGYRLATSPARNSAVQYDELLGWVGKPNAYVPDMYGPGIYVRTNARGFRSDTETPPAVVSEKRRIICAGDSFTFGEGVSNATNWCHQLSLLSDNFETVNMGQPGYGVDQIFLRYMRDGINLDHEILIFAFVDGDLDRMAYSHMYGYGKPILVLDNGNLSPTNVPVPRFRWNLSRMLERADLRSVEFVQRIASRPAEPVSPIDQVGPVATRVFRSVYESCLEKGIVPIFVYLPTERDIAEETPWHSWVASAMTSLDIPMIDLTPMMRRISASEAASFFIPDSLPAGGHYTESGNLWVAEILQKTLMKDTRILGIERADQESD